MRQAKPELTITVTGTGKEIPNRIPSGSRSEINPSGYMPTSSANFLAEALRPEQGRRYKTFSLRKEVIQPQVLLRLPCYDFTPIMSYTLDGYLPCGSAHRLLVQPTFVM